MSRTDSPKTALAHPGDNVTDDELWSYIGARLDRSYDWTAILQGDMSERVRDVISPRTVTANSTLAYRNGEFANLEHEIMSEPKTEANVARLRAARAAHREWRSKMIRFKAMLEEAPVRGPPRGGGPPSRQARGVGGGRSHIRPDRAEVPHLRRPRTRGGVPGEWPRRVRGGQAAVGGPRRHPDHLPAVALDAGGHGGRRLVRGGLSVCQCIGRKSLIRLAEEAPK